MTGKNHKKHRHYKALRGILCVTASVFVCAQAVDANARRKLIPNRPSIEVNLEVLQYLQADTLSSASVAVPFQQKQRVTQKQQIAPAVQAPRQLQTQPLQTQPLPVQRAPMRVASAPAKVQLKLPPPPPLPPVKPYATYQQHGWGDNKSEVAPVKPAPRPKTYTHAPVKPKVISKPKPVVMPKPIEVVKPVEASKPIEIVRPTTPPPPAPMPELPELTVETPKAPDSVAPAVSAPISPPAPMPKLPELTVETPKAPDSVAPAVSAPNLPEPDMAVIDFEEFPKLEPMPVMPDIANQVPNTAPKIAPPETPDMPAPVSLPEPEPMPVLSDLPVSSLPDPEPMAIEKPHMANKTVQPVAPVPDNVTLPSVPDMPAAPLPDVMPAPLPTPPSESALPSLSKGLDDFTIKDQPPMPVGNPDLPDLVPITGGMQAAEPASPVSTGLPSLEALTGVPETPPIAQKIVPPALPDAPSLPSLDIAKGLPELPAADGLPSLAAPAPLEPLSKPVEQQIASLPPIDESPMASAPKAASGSKALTINFAATETEVPVSEQTKLASLAQNMINSGQSVRIEAFAGGSPEQANVARRVSLSRALAIRAYLIDKGVKNLKINVQPLGNKVKGDPERADIIYQ